MFSPEHLRLYREAAGWAIQFEFLIRACAEGLGTNKGTEKNLEGMYRDVVAALDEALTAEQKAVLAALNLCDLRDDIVHSRMSKAFGKLGGKNNDPPVARAFTIAEDQPVVASIAEGMRAGGVPIPRTKTADTGVWIWLMQMAVSGKFSEATAAFQRGWEILNTGMDQNAKLIYQRAGVAPPG